MGAALGREGVYPPEATRLSEPWRGGCAWERVFAAGMRRSSLQGGIHGVLRTGTPPAKVLCPDAKRRVAVPPERAFGAECSSQGADVSERSFAAKGRSHGGCSH